MKHRPSHKLIHTYINRRGAIETRVNSSCNGATDAEAMDVFNNHVRLTETAWGKGTMWRGVPVRITGIVLVDAADNVLAEWVRDEQAVA